MVVTAWILLIVFGWSSLTNSFNYFFGRGLVGVSWIIWILSVVITAFSAGTIWGGLFNE